MKRLTLVLILLLSTLFPLSAFGDHVGLDLDTNEADVGFTWIDSKIVHSKVIDMGACPNATTKTVAHGIAGGISSVLPLSGITQEDASGVVSPFSQSDAANGYDYWKVDTAIGGLITIGSDADRSGSTCTAVLYYTKP